MVMMWLWSSQFTIPFGQEMKMNFVESLYLLVPLEVGVFGTLPKDLKDSKAKAE